MNKIKSYSLALYELAKEENKLNEFVDFFIKNKKDLSSGEVINFFSNFNIKENDKEKILKEITSEELLINWILLLIESRYFKNISDLIESFLKSASIDLNIGFGIIWTTENIDVNFKKILKDLVSTKLNKDIQLENKIDNELIGGIKVIVGDAIWDNTIKNRIRQLTRKLLRERNG